MTVGVLGRGKDKMMLGIEKPRKARCNSGEDLWVILEHLCIINVFAVHIYLIGTFLTHCSGK